MSYNIELVEDKPNESEKTKKMFLARLKSASNHLGNAKTGCWQLYRDCSDAEHEIDELIRIVENELGVDHFVSFLTA